MVAVTPSHVTVTQLQEFNLFCLLHHQYYGTSHINKTAFTPLQYVCDGLMDIYQMQAVASPTLPTAVPFQVCLK